MRHAPDPKATSDAAVGIDSRAGLLLNESLDRCGWHDHHPLISGAFRHFEFHEVKSEFFAGIYGAAQAMGAEPFAVLVNMF
jgi:hypothetical protein